MSSPSPALPPDRPESLGLDPAAAVSLRDDVRPAAPGPSAPPATDRPTDDRAGAPVGESAPPSSAPPRSPGPVLPITDGARPTPSSPQSSSPQSSSTTSSSPGAGRTPTRVVRPDQPSTPPRSEGTVYRARRRAGLTTPGVAVLSTAVGLVFGLISTVLTGGLGWLFGVPLVLISGYCAWEVRESDRRAPLLAPPLTLLVVALVSAIVGDGWLGLTGTAVKVLTTLVAAAPMLVAAEVVVGAVLLVRYLRRRRTPTA